MVSASVFYKSLDWFDLDARIFAVECMDYDFDMDDHPSAILMHFYDVHTDEDAIRIALAFKERIGLVVIERRHSFIEGRLLTVMDVLSNTLSHSRLLNALERVGFLYANYCEQMDLCRRYCADPKYLRSVSELDIAFDLELIKFRHAPISEALAQYFFCPSRIQKFLENGHELEEYMC